MKIGAPWKQSPESTWRVRSFFARSRLSSAAIRVAPPNGPISGISPRSMSVFSGSKSYGMSREWMSEVCRNVTRTS